MTEAQRDAVDILTTDHHDVLDLIAAISASADRQQQRDLADTVIAELVRHSVAEEMYVYPAIREHVADGAEAVTRDIAEHQQLEQTMKKLEGLDPADPDFLAVVEALQEQVLEHATEEEQHQFPQLREAVPAEKLQHLGKRVEQAKEIAPTRPHPASPHAELFHKAVGPGVGFVDKLRDAVSGRARNT